MQKVELGGGTYPKGEGFINVDLVPEADIHHNLEERPYPFEESSVDEVYSSHCLEHLNHPTEILYEICRICKEGATVEIRVPYPGSHMEMCAGHVHVFSPLQAINMEKYFPEDTWKHSGPKRLRLMDYHAAPSIFLQELKRDMPLMKRYSDQILMKWFPMAAHETRFHYQVVKNEYHNLR